MKNTMMWRVLSLGVALFAALTLIAGPVLADDDENSCEAIGLGDDTDDIHDALTDVLKGVVTVGPPAENGGLENNMWGTLVDRDGIVCAVAKTGEDRGDQWPGSRVISAQKAYTANAFSLPAGLGFGAPLSTANLYTAVQPGGSLFGLQFSNPVDPKRAYDDIDDDADDLGEDDDPMVGEVVGGVNVFGGGLALYNSAGVIVGALGVSGDTSCADHIIAWKVRDALGLDNIPGGIAPGNPPFGTDNIIINPATDLEAAFAHPTCAPVGDPDTIAADLPVCFPIGGMMGPTGATATCPAP